MPRGEEAGCCSSACLYPAQRGHDALSKLCCACLSLQPFSLLHIFHHVVLNLAGCQLNVYRECMDLQQ